MTSGPPGEDALALTARDSAAALLAAAGADAGAPHAAPDLPAGLMAALQQATDAPRLRIALCDTYFEGDPVHPEVAAAVRALAKRLAGLGHHVEAERPPLSTLGVIRPLVHVLACGTAMTLQQLQAAHGPIGPDDLEPVTLSAWQLGLRTSGADHLDHLAQLHAVGRRMAGFFERHDLLLTPVLTQPPAPLGRWAMHHADFLDYRIGPEGLWRCSAFAPLAHATGGASLALPAGLSSRGLPIGAMLTGQLGDDTRLLVLAAELECAAPP